MMIRKASHALLLVILVIICTIIFKIMLRVFPRSTVLNYVVSIATMLKCAWDCLFIQSFCQVPNKFDGVTEKMTPELGARVFEAAAAAEQVECAVCLCKIEDGEEVGDLRCHHVFHKACLDRWLGTGRMTCPVCRSHVKPAAGPLYEDLHKEVIMFDFCSGCRDRDTWWLR